MLYAAPAASRLLGPQFQLRLPAPLARLRTAGRAAARRRQPRSPAPQPRVPGAISVAAVAFVAATFRSSPAHLNWRPIGTRALAAARACEGPLYNHYDDGGTLIWFLPGKPVFVDGRQDPYPLPFLLEVSAVEAGAQPHRPLFDRFGIRCAFLPTSSTTVAALDKEGWTTRFRDGKWAVLEAPAPAAGAPTPGVR